MTDRDYVLQQLSNHRRGRDAMQIIVSSIHDRGVGLTVHSRVADLRKDGWEITCMVEGKTRKGRDRYVYRLQGRAASSAKGGSSVGREQRGVTEPPAAAPLDAPSPVLASGGVVPAASEPSANSPSDGVPEAPVAGQAPEAPIPGQLSLVG